MPESNKSKSIFGLSSSVAKQNAIIIGIGIPGLALWREVLFDAIIANNIAAIPNTSGFTGKLLAYGSGAALLLVSSEFSALQFIK